jgi:transmembrane sensor
MHTNFEYLLLKKLLGTISPSEEADFNLWLKANPAFATVYEERRKVWTEAATEDTGGAADEFAFSADQHHKARENKTRVLRVHRPRRTMFFVADIIALIAMIAASFLFYQGMSVTAREFTAGDTVRTVTLSDGTVVSLKPHSKLVVPGEFPVQRTLELEGQAYFNVKHIPGKQLAVNTPYSHIEVVGTSFVVLNDDEKKVNEVVVFNGRVRLTSNQHPVNSVVVTPGKRGKVSPKSDSPLLSYVDTLNMLAWKTDRLTFRKATLYDVATTISAYYNVDVHVHEGLMGCPFTATFNHVPLDEVLDALSESIPVKINRDGRKITLDGTECSRGS